MIAITKSAIMITIKTGNDPLGIMFSPLFNKTFVKISRNRKPIKPASSTTPPPRCLLYYIGRKNSPKGFIFRKKTLKIEKKESSYISLDARRKRRT
ncbi:MAG: hypothetical protein IKD37_02085 [Clostridia bacterium]|nr:hypothetical protein [Clostridia bacterium]